MMQSGKISNAYPSKLSTSWPEDISVEDAIREVRSDFAEQHLKEEIERWFADMDQLAQEIGKRWHKGVNSVDAVRDVRREL
jgi:hypothetical protein